MQDLATICMQDEPTGVPINRATRFENKVGSLDLVAGTDQKEDFGEIIHRSSGRRITDQRASSRQVS